MKTTRLILLLSIAILGMLSCDREDPEATALTLTELADLPAVLDEASGLIIGPNGNLVAHNDKGPYLYEFDFSGNLIKTIEVENADNEDWEDISIDEQGNIYVADVGNNVNDRTDLVIYKIDQAEFSAATSTVSAEAMPFAYEDQTEFPPSPDAWDFDCEAIAVVNNVVCLFSRDRTDPFRGRTRYYQLSGDQAIFQSTFNTDSKKSFGSITASALSPDGAQLALVSNRKIWLIDNFSGLNFFAGAINSFEFDLDLQIEGAYYLDDCTMLLVNENNASGSGRLFRANICP